MLAATFYPLDVYYLKGWIENENSRVIILSPNSESTSRQFTAITIFSVQGAIFSQN